MYSANIELAEILFKHGFIDVTSERDKIKGKRLLKFTKYSQKEIYFDYENIILSRAGKGAWHKYELTEEELKSILYYFKTNPFEYRVFNKSGYFNFEEFQNRLISLRKELEAYTEYNLHKPSRIKIKRILDNYDNIIL